MNNPVPQPGDLAAAMGVQLPEIQAALVAVRDAITEITDTSRKWAEQPTDYDEDTEQQIEDGLAILDILMKHRLIDEPVYRVAYEKAGREPGCQI